jgi:hypothetical protein
MRGDRIWRLDWMRPRRHKPGQRSAPTLIADTGPLVAMLNAKDRHHETCTALFRRFHDPIIVPAH